jgi:hypothetical protein
MARATRATWAERVRRWERSGDTAKRFAARLRVNPNTLKWWKWVVTAEQQSRAEGPAGIGAVQFVELVHGGPDVPGVAADERSGASARSAGPVEGLELSLPRGLRIHLPGQFDAEAVARLVAAIERR